MTDARNFLINTDYPMDKIIYMASGSYSVAAGDSVTSSVAHGLSFAPLPMGTWSTTSDFSVSKECFVPIAEFFDIKAITTGVSSDATNININTYNGSSSTVTIYWRAYCFMPSNVNADVPYTASLSNNFQLNSDYNYTKLYLSDIINSANTTTITHNLGYRPQVISWAKIGGVFYQVGYSYVKVNNTSVIITAPNIEIHYRIYIDGQT